MLTVKKRSVVLDMLQGFARETARADSSIYRVLRTVDGIAFIKMRGCKIKMRMAKNAISGFRVFLQYRPE